MFAVSNYVILPFCMFVFIILSMVLICLLLVQLLLVLFFYITHIIKVACLVRGGKAVNFLKIYKS